MPENLCIRASLETDVGAIQAIYAHHVLHGTGSFETEPPDEAAMAERRAGLLAQGYPHLVAERNGVVIGFAYAGPFRPRAAFRHTVEDSVYVASDHLGTGIGRALLQALVEQCEALGFRQMVAVIGDSANAGSIALHGALGFIPAGCLVATGFKFGRWVDTVFMQRPLGPGATTQPAQEQS
ncbi:MAG: N-acetyltransferase family protein [Rhodospirillaceae bacterium]